MLSVKQTMPPTESTPLVSSAHAGPAILSQKKFTTVLGYIQLLLLIFFLFGTEMKEAEHYSVEEYIIFRDIMVMLLLGFGYLMTFLKKYGLGAVG
jgi:glucose uptake protein GlcU